MRNDRSFLKILQLAVLATWELARARAALARIGPGDVLERNAQAASAGLPEPSVAKRTRDERICAEIAFAITAMARRVPWRSDCLAQALAGQTWLARKRIGSEIVVGATIERDSNFEAHAWLVRDGKVLLGGDVARYRVLLDNTSSPPDCTPL